MSISEIINQALDKNAFGSNFKFRSNQRETIEAICQAYIDDPNSTVILDAPTGTGKSIIAMWCSYILKEMGNRGYLITSDLMLQEQYEKDIKGFKLDWASIKGVDNYECVVNELPFSLGECKFKGMSYEQAEKLSCFNSCGYLQNRRRAIDLPVSLLNYSYWLIQRNYVEDKMIGEERPVPFEQRDFTFFDEAHKIDDIIQGHFSPRIQEDIVDRIMEVNRFASRQGIAENVFTKNKIRTLVMDMLNGDREVAFQALKDFERVLFLFGKMRQAGNKTVKRRYGNESVPKDWQKAFGTFDHLKDVHCKTEDYIDLIEEVGIDKIVLDQKDSEVTFKCVEEALMIEKFLQKKAGFKVFMSATIGDVRSFAKHMKIDGAKVIRLDNQFNFEKSPIVFINRHKLSFKEREDNLPKVIELVDKILDKHKDQSGIIHTGSYQFADYIASKSKHRFGRFITYDYAKERNGAIELFKGVMADKNKVLIGPSLLEGLDFKDDVSRFQIFFKVPYPSLTDPLVKAKINQFPDWYDWKTGISIQQGSGRSIRSNEDWAVTYVVDACFRSLINKPDLFPPSFKQRIKTIK
jgi:ATP-dependent DNA helicase DinG